MARDAPRGLQQDVPSKLVLFGSQNAECLSSAVRAVGGRVAGLPAVAYLLSRRQRHVGTGIDNEWPIEITGLFGGYEHDETRR